MPIAPLLKGLNQFAGGITPYRGSPLPKHLWKQLGRKKL